MIESIEQNASRSGKTPKQNKQLSVKNKTIRINKNHEHSLMIVFLVCIPRYIINIINNTKLLTLNYTLFQIIVFLVCTPRYNINNTKSITLNYT